MNLAHNAKHLLLVSAISLALAGCAAKPSMPGAPPMCAASSPACKPIHS